ncbi:MAG TPA: bifunctional pyr operon transcriptional regulator/uracil phosphoribosyltransferase PyrR [Terriglobales bacterium]|nr:bifunctional pyr operon transcriptional regulator/uracil phosphoribosyltransferase PyrR [Terriglobales bacterium]
MSSQAKPESSPIADKDLLMSASEIQRTLVRLAHEVMEKNNGVEGLALVGIRRRGFPLAQRIAKVINQIEHTQIPVGSLDITLYRDDLSTVGPKPLVQKSDLEISVVGKNVILVDDVLYTGRTIRAALDALFDRGRPARVQLLVLIDRGHRELPIEAAFIGRKVQTTDTQIVEVKLNEVDNLEKVQLVERSERGPTR